MTNEIAITKSGFEKIKEEINDLEAVVAGKKTATGKNSSLKESKRRLDELKDILKRSKIIEPTGDEFSYVQFGCTVTLGDFDTGNESPVRIVSSFEADDKKGFIAVDSELGKALMGRSIGDAVKIKKGSAFKEYEILEISC